MIYADNKSLASSSCKTEVLRFVGQMRNYKDSLSSFVPIKNITVNKTSNDTHVEVGLVVLLIPCLKSLCNQYINEYLK